MKEYPLKKNVDKTPQQGFSLIELIIVLLVVCILSVLTLMAFKGEKKFLADSEAYLILDVLNEAKQRALTQHKTMRVEFNSTTNTVRLISENAPGDAADDQIIKTLVLQHPNYVVTDHAPTNIASSPTENSPVPALSYTTSVHPLSASNQVATLRFLRNGNVVNAGSNAIGNNATLTGATIFVWMPNYSSAGAPMATGGIIRAITLIGTTASSRYWRCEVENGECTTWKQ